MIDRRRLDEPDPFLDWKVRIFFAGAALLVAGVVLKRDVLALVAAAVLAAGAVLMLVTRYRQRRREDARIAEHAEHAEHEES
jgi:Flp pilus assembly protein TadB